MLLWQSLGLDCLSAAHLAIKLYFPQIFSHVDVPDQQ